jgi:hypothetical protein
MIAELLDAIRDLRRLTLLVVRRVGVSGLHHTHHCCDGERDRHESPRRHDDRM